MVIHDVCQVVGREFIGPLPKNLVVKSNGIDLDMTANQVIHLHYPALRHLETDCPVCVALKKRPPLALRH